MRKLLALLLLFIPFILVGQDNLKHIKNPGKKKAKKCRKYYEVIRELPNDIRYSIKVIDKQIIFYFPSVEAFHEIFDKKFDGMAIDIVTRDQFNCNEENQQHNSWAFKGTLLTPVFKKELERRMLVDNNNNVTINFGLLPASFDPLYVECNMILIQKKFQCGYHAFSKIGYNQWELLEMGLYRDSLVFQENQTFKLSKTLTFEIPFKKNLHYYEPAEIVPIYDSLHLSKYFVKAISIQTYSSVEGDVGNNYRLQNARATSIVKGLQAYQSPDISFEISTSENWPDFYNDIKGTQYQYLSKLSKKKIKEALASLDDSAEMESILSSHRKAHIELLLERKILSAEPNEIIEAFGQSIKNNQVKDALYVQNFVFDQIKFNKLPKDFIGKLEIPKLSQFSSLLTNNIIFEYENSIGSIEDHITAFEELLSIVPDNPQIQYNLAALKLKSSNKHTFASYQKEIIALINSINSKVARSLVDRLKINYYILKTEYLDTKKDYREKNRSLKQIYATYRKLNLTDKERLHLARFLSIYSQFKWAEHILAQRAYEGAVSGKLLDCYLRLTIANPRKLNNSKYMRLLMRTIDEHREVFCNLFLPVNQGGYTFQLLENTKLADLYCYSCQDKRNNL